MSHSRNFEKLLLEKISAELKQFDEQEKIKIVLNMINEELQLSDESETKEEKQFINVNDYQKTITFINKLREKLQAILKTENHNEYEDNLYDAIYCSLIALTKYFPLNNKLSNKASNDDGDSKDEESKIEKQDDDFICPQTNKPLTDYNRILTSTGYQYHIDYFLEKQTGNFIMPDAADDNVKLNDRDSEYIVSEIYRINGQREPNHEFKINFDNIAFPALLGSLAGVFLFLLFMIFIHSIVFPAASPWLIISTVLLVPTIIGGVMGYIFERKMTNTANERLAKTSEKRKNINQFLKSISEMKNNSSLSLDSSGNGELSIIRDQHAKVIDDLCNRNVTLRDVYIRLGSDSFQRLIRRIEKNKLISLLTIHSSTDIGNRFLHLNLDPASFNELINKIDRRCLEQELEYGGAPLGYFLREYGSETIMIIANKVTQPALEKQLTKVVENNKNVLELIRSECNFDAINTVLRNTFFFLEYPNVVLSPQSISDNKLLSQNEQDILIRRVTGMSQFLKNPLSSIVNYPQEFIKFIEDELPPENKINHQSQEWLKVLNVALDASKELKNDAVTDKLNSFICRIHNSCYTLNERDPAQLQKALDACLKVTALSHLTTEESIMVAGVLRIFQDVPHVKGKMDEFLSQRDPKCDDDEVALLLVYSPRIESQQEEKAGRVQLPSVTAADVASFYACSTATFFGAAKGGNQNQSEDSRLNNGMGYN